MDYEDLPLASDEAHMLVHTILDDRKSRIAALMAARLGLPLIDVKMSDQPYEDFLGVPYPQSIYINADEERRAYNKAEDDRINLFMAKEIPGKRGKNPAEVAKRRKANRVARKQRRR